MQLYNGKENLDEWKQYLKEYQKDKKFNIKKLDDHKIITARVMKNIERQFDPVNQIYLDQQQEQKKQEQFQEKIKRKQGLKEEIERRYKYNFNIISSQEVKDSNQLKQRLDVDQARHQRLHIKPINNYKDDLKFRFSKSITEIGQKQKNRNFNIISNRHNVEHDKKMIEQQETIRSNLLEKKQRMLQYDIIKTQYNDEKKEEEFQKIRKEGQKNHGKNFSDKFPPSWKYREELIIDPTKEVSNEVKIVDQQKENAMNKFRLRYVIENEYKSKDFADQERNQSMSLNKFNPDKYQEEYQKGFNLISNQIQVMTTNKNIQKQKYSLWDQVRFNANPQYQQPQDQPQRKTLSISLNNSNNFNVTSDVNKYQLPSLASYKQEQSKQTTSNQFKIKTGGFNR